MGLIFSRPMTIREQLLSLESKIQKAEKCVEAYEIHRNNTIQLYYLIQILIFPATFVGVYLTNLSTIAYFVVITIFLNIGHQLLRYFYDLKIEQNKKLLHAYKETQRKQIEDLKKDVCYAETKKIIERYETKDIKSPSNKEKARQRGLVDKVTDIVLGSDPSTLYALICKYCHSHNGLVHPLEYDLSLFKCYNCGEMNDKRKRIGEGKSTVEEKKRD